MFIVLFFLVVKINKILNLGSFYIFSNIYDYIKKIRYVVIYVI